MTGKPMAFYTVTEKWTYDHTTEFRMRLHFKLDDMQAAGDFVRNSLTGDRSIYATDGSPTKIFTSRRAADDYESWLRQEHDPAAIVIQEWADQRALDAFLVTVRDPDHQAHAGPTEEQKRQYREQLGLDAVDK